MPNPKLETYKNKATNVVYDYTDADAQSQLTAIKDGTTIDSFGDVETALSTKYDINDESQISILDYDYVPYYADAESATRKIYWTNIKNGLKGFFDDLYCAIGLVPSGASSSNKLATASDVAAAFPRSEQAVLGAENLFASFVSESKSGMTFTVDSNGVVDVDGQPSANYVNIKSIFTLKKGTYTVSGVPSGFGTSKMVIALYDMNNVQIAVDNGSGATFTINADTQIQGYIYVYQAYGDFDHVKVYPMINLGIDARPFVPFAMTNKELTEKVTLNDITVTPATGITFNTTNTRCIKEGDKCLFNVDTQSISLTADTTLEIGSISSADAPKQPVFGFAYSYNTGSAVRLTINANGKITLLSKTALTNDYIQGSVSWFVNR